MRQRSPKSQKSGDGIGPRERAVLRWRGSQGVGSAVPHIQLSHVTNSHWLLGKSYINAMTPVTEHHEAASHFGWRLSGSTDLEPALQRGTGSPSRFFPPFLWVLCSIWDKEALSWQEMINAWANLRLFVITGRTWRKGNWIHGGEEAVVDGRFWWIWELSRWDIF